ncbi:MAG: anti-sigma factor [Rhizobiaceae bacterium]|nr:anti-sigma factor [Rhizobiaceae bacterium]
MNEPMIFDDETLMAFADGELDEATTKAVERALETDDALMMRVAEFMETRAAARDAFTPAEPVPAELDAAVRGMVELHRAAAQPASNVVSLGDARAKRFGFAQRSWQLPLAASLATAVAAGFIGYQLGQTPGAAPAGSDISGFSSAEIAGVLDSAASGDEVAIADGAGRVRLISSFNEQSGALCREYEVDRSAGASVVAVSCRNDGDWAMRFAVAAPAGGDGYAPASSLDALEAYLGAIEAGPALTEEEERAALDAAR